MFFCLDLLSLVLLLQTYRNRLSTRVATAPSRVIVEHVVRTEDTQRRNWTAAVPDRSLTPPREVRRFNTRTVSAGTATPSFTPSKRGDLIEYLFNVSTGRRPPPLSPISHGAHGALASPQRMDATSPRSQPSRVLAHDESELVLGMWAFGERDALEGAPAEATTTPRPSEPNSAVVLADGTAESDATLATSLAPAPNPGLGAPAPGAARSEAPAPASDIAGPS